MAEKVKGVLMQNGSAKIENIASKGSRRCIGLSAPELEADFVFFATGGKRLEMYNMSSAESARFAEVVREMTQRIKEL